MKGPRRQGDARPADEVNPDLDWYMEESERRGLSPRCPFASVHRCPRYYSSTWLLGSAGSTKIPPELDAQLLERWERSDLWPATLEQEPGILGDDFFMNFCPEVLYERFGLFATTLAGYTDDIDRDLAHRYLEREGAPRSDSRWRWELARPMHFSACPLYSPLTGGVEERGEHRPVRLVP